jgi:F-type H+-transporting ATPase subunit b
MKRYGIGVAVVVLGLLLAVPAFAAEGEQSGLFHSPQEGFVTALTTLVIFIILVAVLGRFAWGPIASGLQAREERIRKDIADAEAARARAEATLREYNTKLASAEEEVRALIARATADGERVANNIRIQAQQEAEDIKNRATRDIEQSRKQAIAEIYQTAADIATDMAEKILRRTVNREDQRELLGRSLEQLETMN